ncbi:hypothetical protein HRbin10_00729 [bacterium HR10]|nr:hypothetical protein HRbin10_00729 [bacterium HR10]
MEIRDLILLFFVFFQASLGLLLIGRFLMNVWGRLRSKTDGREAKNQV